MKKISELINLENKVALITGGSRGLGFQFAEALGELGAKVVITARKEHELSDAKNKLSEQSIDSETFTNDLQNFDQIPELIKKILDKFSKIDILVNNAGAAWGAPAENHPDEAWDKVMNLNLNSVFRLSKEVAVSSMIPNKYGKIINIASIAGLVGTNPDFMPTISYNTSKGGLINFTKSLAAEWAKYKITVNAIAPGVFPSKMSTGMIDRSHDYILNQTPMRRLGEDFELKGTVALLASDLSTYITGQTIPVDGGFSII